ncbi:MAG TPA: F0F1 ATP synthase subunit B [Longimicrobiales bacterium]|nr:F0F1 ATP synthase subunit B [Longimicrobiales bacterium]
MNSVFLFLQEHAPEGTEAAHEPSIFGINAGVSFWTLIIFLLLLFVLMKYAFPPILGYAAAREQRIQDALDEARKQREEAERLLEQQRAELADARVQAQQFIAEGKQAAERVREDMLARAKAEQEELVARAKQDIVTERERAIESLRREAVDLAMAAAGKLLGQRVDAAEDRRLVTAYLKSADSGRGAGAA